MRSQRRRFIPTVTAITLLLVGISPTALSGPPPGFTDGAWEGDMIYSGEATWTAVEATAGVAGVFDLTVAGGLVTDGSFTVTGVGSSQLTDASGFAHLTISFSGSMVGTASAPALHPTGGSMSGVAGVEGLEVPIDIPLSGALVDIPMEILLATCEIVSGDWTQQVEEAVGSSGGTLNVLEGLWVATRTGDASDADNEELHAAIAQLMYDADQFNANLSEGGAVSGWELHSLLSRAEAIGSSIERNTACGIASPGFSTVITSIVAGILQTMIDNADLFGPEEWHGAVLAGVRAGAIGSGASDPKAGLLESEILAIAAADLAIAIAEGDAGGILAIFYIADMLEDASLAAEAKAAYLATP
jgi:hypothetical protein